MDIGVIAQILSSLATFVVAAGILYQGREARKARDDQDRPQIIVDADYTGRFTTNIVVRNIGHGMAKNITFEFSSPIETTSGEDITELPYFKHGINFMAPQTDIAAVWDSYQNVVQNLRYKGYEDQVQALEDQARALERIAKDIRQAVDQRHEDGSESAEMTSQQNVTG